MQNTLTAAAVMLITSSQAINTKQAVTQNRALLAQTNQNCGSVLNDASVNARSLADKTVGSIRLTADDLQKSVVKTYNQTKVSIQRAVQELEETVQSQIDATVSSVNSDLQNLKFAIEGVAGDAASGLDAAGCFDGCGVQIPSPQVFLVDIPQQEEPVAYLVQNVDPTQPASIFVSQGSDNSDPQPSIIVQQPSDGSDPVVIVNDEIVNVVVIGSNDSTPAVVTVENDTAIPDTYVVSDATDENPTVSVLIPNVDISTVQISVDEALQADSNASSNDDQNSESNDDSQQNINVWWPITNDNGEVIATGDSNGAQTLETYDNVEVPRGEETPVVYSVDSGAASEPIVYTYTDVDGATAYVVDSQDQNATITIVQGSESDSEPVVLVDDVEIVPVPIDISTNPYIVVASDSETDVPNTYIVADDETIQEVDSTPVLQVVSARDTSLDSSSDVLNTFTAVFNSDGDFDSVIINNTSVTPEVYDNVSYANVVDETVPEPVVIDLDLGASEPVVFVSYPTDPTESPTYYIDNGNSSDATVTIDDSGAQTVVTIDDVVVSAVDISDVVQPAIYITSGDDIYVADLAFTDNDGNLTNVYALASSDDDQVATASGSDSGLTFIDPVIVADVVPDFVPVTDPINDQVISISYNGQAETQPDIVEDVVVVQPDVQYQASSGDDNVEPIVIAVDLPNSEPVVLVSYAETPDQPDVYYVSNGNTFVDTADSEVTVDVTYETPVVTIDNIEVTPVDITDIAVPSVYVNTDGDVFVADLADVDSDQTPVVYVVPSGSDEDIVEVNPQVIEDTEPVFTPILDPIDNVPVAIIDEDGEEADVEVVEDVTVVSYEDTQVYVQTVEPIVIAVDLPNSEPVVLVSYAETPDQPDVYYVSNGNTFVDTADSEVTVDVTYETPVVTIDNIEVTPVDITDIAVPSVYVNTDGDVFVADLADVDSDQTPVVYVVPSGSDEDIVEVNPQVIEDTEPVFTPILDPIDNVPVAIIDEDGEEADVEVVEDVTVVSPADSEEDQVVSPAPVVIEIDTGSSDPVVLVQYASDPEQPDVYYVDNGSSGDDVTVDTTGQEPVVTIGEEVVTVVDISEVSSPAVVVSTDGTIYVADNEDLDSDDNPVVYEVVSNSDSDKDSGLTAVTSSVDISPEPLPTVYLDVTIVSPPSDEDSSQDTPVSYVDQSESISQVEPVVIEMDIASTEPVVLVSYAETPDQPDVYYIHNAASENDNVDSQVTVDYSQGTPVVTIDDIEVTPVDITDVVAPSVYVNTDGDVFVADLEDVDEEENPVVYIVPTDSDQEFAQVDYQVIEDSEPAFTPILDPTENTPFAIVDSTGNTTDADVVQEVTVIESDEVQTVEPIVIAVDLPNSEPVVLVSYAETPDQPDVYYVSNGNTFVDTVDSTVYVDNTEDIPIILIDEVEVTPIDITDVLIPSVYVNTDGDVFVADLADVDSDENPVVYAVPSGSDEDIVEVNSQVIEDTEPVFTPILDPIENVPIAIVDENGETNDVEVVEDVTVVEDTQVYVQTVEPIVIAVDLPTSDPVVLVSYAETPDQPDVYYVSNGNTFVDTADSEVTVDVTYETPVVTIDNIEVTPVDITDIAVPSVYVNTDGDVFVADLADVDSDQTPVVYVVPSGSDEDIVEVNSQVIEDTEPVFTPILDPIDNVPVAIVDEDGDEADVEVVEDVTVVSFEDTEVYVQTVEPIVIAVDLPNSDPVVLVSYAETPDQPDVYYVSNGNTFVDTADSEVTVDVTYETPVVTIDNIEVTPVDITDIAVPSVYVNTDGDVFVADLADVDSDQTPVVYVVPSGSDEDIVEVNSQVIEDTEPVFTPILDPIDNVPVAIIDEDGDEADVEVVEDVTVVASFDDETQADSYQEPVVLAIDIDAQVPTVIVNYSEVDTYYIDNAGTDASIVIDTTGDSTVVYIDDQVVQPIDVTDVANPAVIVSTDGDVYVVDQPTDSDQESVVYVAISSVETDQDLVEVQTSSIDEETVVVIPFIATEATVIAPVAEEESSSDDQPSVVTADLGNDEPVVYTIASTSDDSQVTYIVDAATSSNDVEIALTTDGEGNTVVVVDGDIIVPLPAPAESDSETDFWPVYNPVTNEVVAVVTSGDSFVPVTTISTEDSDIDSEQVPCEDLLSEAEQQIADQEAEIAELEAQLAALQDN